MRKGKYDDKVSKFIDEFWRKEFRSPVIREVMDACGITSTSVADYVIRKVCEARKDIFTDGKFARITPNWVALAIKNAPNAIRWAERCKMEGSRNIQVTPNITLGCISPEARDLLDTIVAEYQKHYDGMVAMNLKGTHPDDVYGAFYWLVRWSGLVQPNIACTGQGAGAGNTDGESTPAAPCQ